MIPAPRNALLTTVLAVAAAAAPAAASPPGTTVLVDRPDGFGAALSGAGAGSAAGAGDAVSATGRYVVFTSAADGLSPADDDRVVNVYRKDRATGAVVLVSVATGGTPSRGDAGEPQISDDGNRIAFAAQDPALDPSANGGARNVYVRDVAAGTTTLASRASGASGLPVEATAPALSGDGAAVAFVTTAALSHDANSVPDVYVRRLAAQQTELVSRSTGADGTSGTRAADEPSLDADGTEIAFSTASALHPEDKNNRRDVYRRSTGTGQTPYTDLVSVRESVFAAGNGESFDPSISADGASVAYRSSATDLDSQVTDTDGGAA
ncbi:MAG TPA: hypothetical protein VD836_07435, partial [Solirubrobacteraceae bacterium]|nr:hypothetical protein [Solirubrobacteraceae bacterium]